MHDQLKPAGWAPDRRKPYHKPAISAEKEIEALTGTCEPLGMDTGQDKLASDPNTGTCRNPVT